MTVTSTPPGIPSPARLADWISDRLGGEPAELAEVELIAGGRSNLTYRLTFSVPGADRGAAPGAERGADRGLVVPTLVARAHEVLDADAA
jgi:aminoglycoside phosphotransferase (APT) family kinase protein